MDFKRKPIKLNKETINEFVEKILRIDAVKKISADKEKGEVKIYDVDEYNSEMTFKFDDQYIVTEKEIYPVSLETGCFYTAYQLNKTNEWLNKLNDEDKVINWCVKGKDDNKKILNIETCKDYFTSKFKDGVIVFMDNDYFEELFSTSEKNLRDAMFEKGYFIDE